VGDGTHGGSPAGFHRAPPHRAPPPVILVPEGVSFLDRPMRRCTQVMGRRP
jgi:hypothetical protein